MVSIVDRQGEVLIWCRKRFGYARQRMGPKLMDRCKPKKRGTKSNGKTLKRILILEERKVHAKSATGWKIEGQKRRSTRKEYQRLKGI